MNGHRNFAGPVPCLLKELSWLTAHVNPALWPEILCLCLPLQQSYVSSGHQMAPPSPNTNSSSNSSGGGGEQLSKTNLYIRGLHPGTTDQDLVKLCQP